MLMTIEHAPPVATDGETHILSRASAMMEAGASAVAIQMHRRARALKARLNHPVNLRSRRGAGDMIWTILVVGLVAVVAAGSIYVFGPKIIAMGGEAASKLSAPPW